MFTFRAVDHIPSGVGKSETEFSLGSDILKESTG